MSIKKKACILVVAVLLIVVGALAVRAFTKLNRAYQTYAPLTRPFQKPSSAFEAEVKKLKAAGEPVCLEDMAPHPVPNEDNAAWYFRQAALAASKSELEVDVKKRDADVRTAIDKMMKCSTYVPLFDYANSKGHLPGSSSSKVIEPILAEKRWGNRELELGHHVTSCAKYSIAPSK